MDINITQFYQDSNPMNYSASVSEIGNDAGAVTWQAACEDAPEYNLLDNADKLAAMRKWAVETGAWSAKEVDSMADNELNALFIQVVSGDMREKEGMTWEEYEADDSMSHTLFQGIDNEIYYYLGN